ncbi:MAG: DUF4433 domain-containing protein [Bacillota bacterium]
MKGVGACDGRISRSSIFITPINNLRSILQIGILCYEHAQAIPHESIAMEEIQRRRADKIVPGGRPLHQYVNLYFSARNPMMFARKEAHQNLCVLQILSEVMDLPGVIVTDGNASSNYTWFRPASDGIRFLEEELIYARDWRHSDLKEYWRRKSAKCAEVLVPDRVDPSYIAGIYVSCPETRERIRPVSGGLPINVKPDLFFLEI